MGFVWLIGALLSFLGIINLGIWAAVGTSFSVLRFNLCAVGAVLLIGSAVACLVEALTAFTGVRR